MLDDTVVPVEAPRPTVIDNSSHERITEARLLILRSEQAVRDAELAQARAAAAAASSALALAKAEAEFAEVCTRKQTPATMNKPAQVSDVPPVQCWVNEQAKIEQKDTIRPRNTAPMPYVGTSNKIASNDIELLAQRFENAVGKGRRDPVVQRHVAELPKFDGSISEWIAFKAEFNDTEAMFSEVANVGRIRRALRGDAKYAVKALLYTTSDPFEIMDMLELQFGNPEALVLAEIEEVKRLPKLSEDNHNIVSFAGQVANVVATIKSLHQEQYLMAPELVNRLVDKMSVLMRHEWNKHRVQNPKELGLVSLSKFLTEASKAAGLTVTHASRRSAQKKHSVNAVAQSRHRSRSRSTSRESYSETEYSYKRSSKPFIAQVSKKPVEKKSVKNNKPKTHTNAPRVRESNSNKCTVCSGEHYITKCADFLKLNVDERWTKMKEFKLCYRCLGPYHRRFNKCKYVPCGTGDCEAAHHKLLHGTRKESETRKVQSSISHLHDKDTYLKVMPVEVSGPLGSVQTYGLLDEGAGLTLIERHIADQVTPRTRSCELSLNTVGDNTLVDNESCEVNVSIRGLKSENVNNLTAFTVEKLGLHPQGINKEVLSKCAHLEELRDELTYATGIPTVLIGQDNWHLIVTRELIEADENLPAASYTKLGWVLHGAEAKPRKLIATINHVSRRDEQDTHELIKQHFNIESLGVEPKINRSDPNNRAFEILNATCKKIQGEDRYEAGLLWKTDNETLPNNKDKAMKRLVSLEKLDRDDGLKAEYSRQIQNLLDKGYAERIHKPNTSPREYYLPHFATFHPQKGKPRLVFDGKCKMAGKSLNEALLVGPDLLLSLFGVLIRFREGKVAVIADIAEMFLQVRVIEQDRDSRNRGDYLARGLAMGAYLTKRSRRRHTRHT
ncbi:uncharacterized protein LOC125228681 [Leguminivora glycinivorella]|uniref:uncharacterized protein LOC125228681 n=1 Tax=Leguminivora glycinivorella TaxID=1035111 RepID=UPI00200EE70B|nr:uncharacterized protein LOC125228681 [Leguminivora glycinivorella]